MGRRPGPLTIAEALVVALNSASLRRPLLPELLLLREGSHFGVKDVLLGWKKHRNIVR